MLVETKAITEMGLTFGNTWQVIGIVIAKSAMRSAEGWLQPGAAGRGYSNTRGRLFGS